MYLRSFLFGMLMLISFDSAHANLRDGLIGWWKLDEGTGTVANDSSSLGNHGTLVNTPTWITGKRGKGLDFVRASSQYVSIAGGATYCTTAAAFSVSFWTKFTTHDGSNNVLFGLKTDATTAFSANALTARGYNDFTIGKDAASSMRVSFPAISPGRWWHIVIVYNGSGFNTPGNYTLYIDTVSVAVTASGNLVGIVNTSYLGAISTGSPSHFANGSLDDVRVYNRALTVQEVADLYRPGIKIGSGVVGNGKMNQ